MTKIIKKSTNFIKNETIFTISLILAITSSFIIKPNPNYINYINWQTIILLLIIMIIIEIIKNLSIFEIIIQKLLTNTNNTRNLILILVFTTFFTSTIITNDVSLIILTPFTIITLKKLNQTELLIPTISMQTIAANAGSMILPTGAPHNIVIYTTSHIPFASFIQILLPYIIISAIFLITLTLLIPKKEIKPIQIKKTKPIKENLIKKVFKGIDYYLILTFIALFILIGNLENITYFNTLFTKSIQGNEVLYGVIISQIISNVPSAILLTGFSTNYEAIIIGINIGGFGTLIASMANLISYKILIREYKEFKIKYLTLFTIHNIILLIILLTLYSLTQIIGMM